MPNMRSVGCAVGETDCVVYSRQHSGLIRAHIFACIFAYKRFDICLSCRSLSSKLLESKSKKVKLGYIIVLSKA